MDRGTWKATVHGVTESDTTKQLLPPSVRALSTCLSLALLISSLYWPAQKFRVSFSMRCYRKTWTNLFANPILLPISRKREEEIVPLLSYPNSRETASSLSLGLFIPLWTGLQAHSYYGRGSLSSALDKTFSCWPWVSCREKSQAIKRKLSTTGCHCISKNTQTHPFLSSPHVKIKAMTLPLRAIASIGFWLSFPSS